MNAMTRRQFAALALVAAVARRGSAATGDPPDDGTWSTNPLWRTLKLTRLTTDDRGMVHATIAPEVLQLVGKPMSISGFILPVESATSYNHFVLSRYSPECPFCPSGAPNEVIEVFSKKPFSAGNFMVFLEGTFAVQNDVEKGLFYRLDKATDA